jgi:putative hemolysin
MGYETRDSDCVFPSGARCEQWAFFRGTCGQAQSFCARSGGTVANVVEDRGGFTASYARCTLPSGTSCEEQAFASSCRCE